MNEFFFHDRDAMIAPPPVAYAAFTLRRAIWQAVGLHPEDMTARDYFAAIAFLRAEAADDERRRSRKSDA